MWNFSLIILFFFIDSNISTSAYSLMNGSCVNGGSGGTIIIRAKNVCFLYVFVNSLDTRRTRKSLVQISSCSNTGSIRDNPYWTSTPLGRTV